MEGGTRDNSQSAGPIFMVPAGEKPHLLAE